ncbi:hypothetical protein OK016_17155 [Vibrio chagasii]|nr:hypothetical protein [Vibrio chagasii]
MIMVLMMFVGPQMKISMEIGCWYGHCMLYGGNKGLTTSGYQLLKRSQY